MNIIKNAFNWRFKWETRAKDFRKVRPDTELQGGQTSLKGEELKNK